MTNIIQNLQPNVGHLKLTRTMLDKHIIDANASVQKLALLLGVDMAKLAFGEKLELVGEYTDGLMDKSTPNQNTIQAKRWGLICEN